MQILTRRLFFFALVLMGTCTLAHAQSTPKKGTLADISFLDGRWQGTYNGGPIDAAWTAPAGNNVAGFIRMMKDDKATLYEIFAFEQGENGPVAMVKHFRPGMISVEEKEVADRYRFIEAKKGQALFEKDDASVRIIYELRRPDQLVIQRGKSEGGQWAFVDLFVFNRIK
ncbi:hypothetical protein GCM10027275_00910 [Rhabdobacter roseus]|uniref:DUF6265 domain-containing protein n=1 Tax=Rhabdobacter roseus TaxID=1655419 RepID=A0A840TGA5_9BACT|nr:DUF6265 family protein [Rhabdobacter roseus]MBB5281975.1 hypothetical protein [Rhabdobacter roseus]